MQMQMQDNGPQGSIIFDTEAQTLSTANHLDCGNFDDMLRKAFEHENIDSSYKANGLIPIYIRHPKLALLLTGTPGQIDGLLSSYENGLPSRTLIYTFREAPHWKEMGDDCVSLEDSFKPIAHRVSELYHFCLAHPVLFHFNRLQWNRLNEIFSMFRRNKYVWLYAIIMLCYNISTSLAVTTYYFKYIIGNTAMMSVTSIFSIVLLPLMLVFPWIMKKIGGMSKMVGVFACIGIVGYIIVFVSGANLTGVLLGGVLGGLAGLPLAYYGVLFIMNCCTYNEMIGLPRMDGSAGILANFMGKCGGAMGSFITGILLSVGGYIAAEGTVDQPASALMMIRIDYALVPAVLMIVIAACSFGFMKLEKKIPAWEAAQKAKAEATPAENA